MITWVYVPPPAGRSYHKERPTTGPNLRERVFPRGPRSRLVFGDAGPNSWAGGNVLQYQERVAEIGTRELSDPEGPTLAAGSALD